MADEKQIVAPPPPSLLKSVQVSAGSWNKFMRILVFGPAKSGKSFMLASMPKPILCASGGDEQGIAQYLDPAQGDVCFDISTPDQLTAFIEYGMKNISFFRSICFDPITPMWNDYMDVMGKKHGNSEGEIKGKAWGPVKAPWALFMRQLKRSKLDVGMSAWVNDILYETVEEQPGIEKLKISQQVVPKVEKRIPHHVDLIFEASQVLDGKKRPTPFHEITFAGGRRPRTINPKDLYVGKKWKFDERDPKSPWAEIIEPIRVQWQDAAGAVDCLGPLVDPVEAEMENGETDQIAEDYKVGAMLRFIDTTTAKNLQEYKAVFDKDIAPFINSLKDPAARARVEAAHNARKAALGGAK